MFVVSTIESANIDAKELSGEGHCCLFMFNAGISLGCQAAYNAVGYVLLNSNSLMTHGLSLDALLQAGAVGTTVDAAAAFALVTCELCCSEPSQPSPECRFATGPCIDILASVIRSLLGAQITGLFVNNVTTPAYVAANAATGAAVISGGLFATIVVIGGTAYCIGEMDDDSCVFIPCKVAKRFSVGDLVRPCELGLEICNRQQMLEFLNRCRNICPSCECLKPTPQAGAPKSEVMERTTAAAPATDNTSAAYNPNPDMFVRIDQIPMAIALEAEPAPATAPVPSAPGVEMMQRTDSDAEGSKGQGNRLTLT